MSATRNTAIVMNGLKVSQDGNSIIHDKIIYAKRKEFTNKQFEGVMQLEISNFIREHSGFEFEKVGVIVKNSDKSKTYPLHFKKVTN